MGHFILRKGKLVEVSSISDPKETTALSAEQLATKLHEIWDRFTNDDFKKDGGLKVNAAERELNMEVTAEGLNQAQMHLDVLLKHKD